jgi:hypothetical protein
MAETPTDPEAEALLKEAERLAKVRKFSVGGAGAPAPVDVSERGIIGWLKRNNIARDMVQANLILIGVIIVCVLFVVWFWWPETTPTFEDSGSPPMRVQM